MSSLFEDFHLVALPDYQPLTTVLKMRIGRRGPLDTALTDRVYKSAGEFSVFTRS